MLKCMALHKERLQVLRSLELLSYRNGVPFGQLAGVMPFLYKCPHLESLAGHEGQSDTSCRCPHETFDEQNGLHVRKFTLHHRKSATYCVLCGRHGALRDVPLRFKRKRPEK